MNLKSIGKNLQERREEIGITQEKFAELIFLSPNYVSAVERGVKTPSLDTFISMINTLHISADVILRDVNKFGYEIKASQLTKELSHLSENDRSRILAIIEAYIKDAKRKEN